MAEARGRGNRLNVAVIGAGIFGLAAAIELRGRGHAVTVFERGATPNELASSTDTSKTIRRLYGTNGTYVELVERAALGWRRWEAQLPHPIYFQTGQLQVERNFRPGFRIHDSWQFMRARGSEIRLLTIPEAQSRYPQFTYEDGETCLYDPWGGYIASGLAVAGLATLARDNGVAVLEDTPASDVGEASSAVRVTTRGGRLSFDRAVVAAGVWMTRLVPQLARGIRPTRQEMAFFEPSRPSAVETMPVWGVNVETDGWYGHPLRREGWVKVANDLLGEVVDPDEPRIASPAFLEAARQFVAGRIPALASGRLVAGRVCLYENTPDRHLVIDWVPGSQRILVAGGGSGHGFKFGGSIGEIIADALEHKANRLGDPFRIGQRFG